MKALVSRKLAAALVAILIVGFNGRLGFGLTDVEVQAIVSIALAVIGAQGSVDLTGAVASCLNRCAAPTNTQPSEVQPHA